MPNGEGFNDAVSQVRELPGLGVGIHLSLVCERPIASAHKIRGLVDSDGRLPSSYADFARAYLLRKFTPREVHREMEAQIARVLHAGVRPTHLDGHQHVHLMPGVFDIALDLAEAYKIRVVRVPHDRAVFSPALASLSRRLSCFSAWTSWRSRRTGASRSQESWRSAPTPATMSQSVSAARRRGMSAGSYRNLPTSSSRGPLRGFYWDLRPRVRSAEVGAAIKSQQGESQWSHV
jgi:hypothetical protein